MKSIPAHIVFLFLILGNGLQHAIAQKTITEATLKYQINAKTYNGSDSVNLSADGASYTVFIKDNQTRSDFSNRYGNETVIYDKGTGQGVFMKSYGAQHLLYNMTQDNWNDHISSFFTLQFKDSPGRSVVNNMNCKMAIATLGQGKSILVYYNPDIILSNNQYGLSFQQINGLPIKIIKVSGKDIYEYVLTGISYDQIAITQFNSPKSGFRVMTYEEAKKSEQRP